MATLVCFHAHPDDECIATGGTMARAADEGHRVVLVVATKGEHGEVAEDFLDEGEALWERRVRETAASAQILGVSRVEFLGYVDSGMQGTPENDKEGSFWTADLEEAAGRLAAILDDEHADVLTTYDEHGVYGHPDHVKVHTVGRRAAELAGTPRVYEATLNRDHIIRGREEQLAARAAGEHDGMPDIPDVTEDPMFGMPEERITAAIDVSAYAARKRAAMRAHASQIGETHFFLMMPDEVFARAFGMEWFIRPDAEPGVMESSLTDGL
jgi:LmbE family N-acetylglucosaminyl deacetylase